MLYLIVEAIYVISELAGELFTLWERGFSRQLFHAADDAVYHIKNDVVDLLSLFNWDFSCLRFDDAHVYDPFNISILYH